LKGKDSLKKTTRFFRELISKAVVSVVLSFVVLFAVGANSAEIVTGPILEFPGTERMTVFWETDVASKGEIKLYDRAGGEIKEGVTRSKMENSTFHRARLSGLAPATEYGYSVLVDDKEFYKGRFKTLPADGEYRVVLVGDIHAPWQHFSRLAPLIDKKSPDFIVLLGDLIYEGDNKHEWESFFELGRNLFNHIPIIPVIGDHDCNGETGPYFYDTFFLRLDGGRKNNRYYAEKVCGDLFIFLDVELRPQRMRQWIWFVDTLLSAKMDDGVGRIFVLSHEGVISFKGNRKGYGLLKHFLGIMKFAGVSALFSGHDHHFVTGKTHNGTDFFVTGGGGGSLYKINPDNFYAKFVGTMEKSYEGYHFLVMDVTDDGFTVKVINDEGEEVYRKEIAEPK
jgi:hypothetical protein